MRHPSRPLKLGQNSIAVGILQILEGDIRLGQAKLLALIEADGILAGLISIAAYIDARCAARA